MPVSVYCSECGEEVVGRVVDGELIACSHPDPNSDDLEEECPGSNCAAEYASGPTSEDEGPEFQETDGLDDEGEDLGLKPQKTQRRGRPRLDDRDQMDLEDLKSELPGATLKELLS